MFRDSQTWHSRQLDQVGRYFRQLEGTGLNPSYFLVEGNSQDDTAVALAEWATRLAPRVNLFTHEVSGSHVVSRVDEVRFRNLSAIANTAFQPARDSGADLVLWVESDFILPDGWMGQLLDATKSPWWREALGVCPLPIFHRGGPPLFYDTWAFEGTNGKKWANEEVPSAPPGERYLPLRAAGSCILFRGDALRAGSYEFRDSGCLPGVCREAVASGLKLFCDTTVRIHHPSSENVGGRLV